MSAALEAFADGGVDATPVSAIAARAQVNISVLYDHFRSKAELHAALLDDQIGRLIAHQRDHVIATPPGRARLRAAYEGFFSWAEANPAGVRLLFRDVVGSALVADAQLRVQTRATRAIAGFLLGTPERDAETGSAHLDLVAEFLKGGTSAVAAWWQDNPNVDRAALVDRITDLTWGGLAPLGAQGRLDRPATASSGPEPAEGARRAD